MKIMKLGYVEVWNKIEHAQLNQIIYESRSVMSKYDRALRQLKYATATDITMARVFYTIADMELSLKMDLAAEALENITKLYYAYINAEPNLHVEITPNGRYDDALIPYSLLMTDTESQQRYYNNLTNALGMFNDLYNYFLINLKLPVGRTCKNPAVLVN